MSRPPRRFECAACNKRFKTRAAAEQHYRDKHGDPDSDVEDYDPPYPGMDGEWVLPCDFRGRKSFGLFACAGCENRWMSAHAQPRYTQGCQRCERGALPKAMWQNAGGGSGVKSTKTPPHHAHRCEACRLGVCGN